MSKKYIVEVSAAGGGLGVLGWIFWIFILYVAAKACVGQ